VRHGALRSVAKGRRGMTNEATPAILNYKTVNKGDNWNYNRYRFIASLNLMLYNLQRILIYLKSLPV